MATLRRETVSDSWNYIVENGAGRDKWVLDTTETSIKEARMPSIDCRQEEVTPGLFGEKRIFIIVTHSVLKDYKMYINARDYGVHLDVSWYLTVEPRFLKRSISKYAMGNPYALSSQIDLFSQQDLSAFTTVAHHCVKRTLEELLAELELDPSGLNTKSKGFLSVW